MWKTLLVRPGSEEPQKHVDETTTLQQASGLCEKTLCGSSWQCRIKRRASGMWKKLWRFVLQWRIGRIWVVKKAQWRTQRKSIWVMWTGSEEPTEDHLDLWKKSCAVRPGSEEPNERASGLWEKTLCGSQWRPRKNSLSLMRKKDCEKGSGFVLNGRTRHRSQRRSKEELEDETKRRKRPKTESPLELTHFAIIE